MNICNFEQPSQELVRIPSLSEGDKSIFGDVFLYNNEMIPSLYPMINDSSHKALLYYIKNLMANQYATCPELKQLQPLVDVGNFVTTLNGMLPEVG